MNALGKRITGFIAKLGQNPDFVAFNAHCWFAFSVMKLALVHGAHPVVAIMTGMVVAGLKEFYFDAKYELNPTQTFDDNLKDFAGYVAGLTLAAIV